MKKDAETLVVESKPKPLTGVSAELLEEENECLVNINDSYVEGIETLRRVLAGARIAAEVNKTHFKQALGRMKMRRDNKIQTLKATKKRLQKALKDAEVYNQALDEAIEDRDYFAEELDRSEELNQKLSECLALTLGKALGP